LNVAAITHLVAGSVEGLKSENITVVDSQGRLLSSESDQPLAGGAGSVADYRERVEQSLSNKVEDMLTAVLGPGRATVRVSAEIDMTSINTVKKSYEGKGVVVDEEIKEKSKIDPGSAEGEAIGKENDNTITTKKLFDETMETIVDLPGDINSLQVAAFVDLYPDDPNSTDLIVAESDVTDIIKNALGLKDSSAIKVVNARFHRPVEPLIGDEEAGGLDFVAIAGQASLGIMAICALFVLKMFSGAKKKAASMPESEQLSLTGGAMAGFLPAGTDDSQSQVLRKQIAHSLQNNPGLTKQLFSSWLQEKGS
jgi:flagellar M-ring protein FliF